MALLNKIVLLFALNLLDAVLTIVWVRSGIATEGNQLMARVMDFGDHTFLAVKVAMGLTTAVVLFRSGNSPLARYGLGAALCIYLGLMGVHILTGLTAFGFEPLAILRDLAKLSNYAISFLI